jgi:hypothetical protein
MPGSNGASAIATKPKLNTCLEAAICCFTFYKNGRNKSCIFIGCLFGVFGGVTASHVMCAYLKHKRMGAARLLVGKDTCQA